ERRDQQSGHGLPEREAVAAAEARADFEAGRLRLAVQLDAFRASVRELCERMGVPCQVSAAQEGHGA
ncbi:hypothetical protein LXT21_44335, partial [Myxococcus sp. K38C18041901]|uniref:hypothetical protein n=1 Tax=Myxococcus guangdongensis TaxID=2906760 RepID=UPI0020A749E7